jgi:FMN phosphatase YigB (HAD superfamily)
MAQLTKVVFFDLGNTLVVSGTTKWNLPAKDVLSDLKNSGVRLGLISNTANLTRAKLKQLLPLDFDFNVFEANLVLLSSEIGIEKPSLEIFELAISRTGISASECLYCSEDFQETLGAQRVGMVGARIQPPPNSDLGTFVDFLRKLKFLQ